MQSVAPTYKNKVNVVDTVVFGGDIGASGSAPASWTSGASSVERAAGGNYVELDFTFDAKTAGHGIVCGLSDTDPSQSDATVYYSWKWDTTGNLLVVENNVVKSNVGAISLPMSCRIIFDAVAGTLTYRKNSGSDVLQYTSLLTAAQVRAAIEQGLIVDTSFYNTSGKLHATLKADNAHIAAPTFETVEGVTYVSNEGHSILRVPQFSFGVDAAPPKPRPTSGKIWPRLP